MSTEQTPESCQFCGAGILIGVDGRECRSQNQLVTFQCFTNWHPNYREPRRSQSFECIAAERDRLTRERDEEAAKADHLCIYSTSLETANRQLTKERADLLARVKRLEEAGAWIPAAIKPGGFERRVLCWVVWPQCGWPNPPEAVIGWWKHGPGCFAVQDIENADHLVTHWMEISDPSKAKEAKP